MMNLSKKTRKKIQTIISDHFGESGDYLSGNGVTYTPEPNSPLSAIWKKVIVRSDGEYIGYLLDNECNYIAAGQIARRKLVKHISSPEQLFHPRCHFARQAKQIAYRLDKMDEKKLAKLFYTDAVWIAIVNREG